MRNITGLPDVSGMLSVVWNTVVKQVENTHGGSLWSAVSRSHMSCQLSYRAREIFSKFLCSKATTPVNIDSQAQLADDILSAPHPDMFKEQQLQVTTPRVPSQGASRGLMSKRAGSWAGTGWRGGLLMGADVPKEACLPHWAPSCPRTRPTEGLRRAWPLCAHLH